MCACFGARRFQLARAYGLNPNCHLGQLAPFMASRRSRPGSAAAALAWTRTDAVYVPLLPHSLQHTHELERSSRSRPPPLPGGRVCTSELRGAFVVLHDLYAPRADATQVALCNQRVPFSLTRERGGATPLPPPFGICAGRPCDSLASERTSLRNACESPHACARVRVCVRVVVRLQPRGK